MMKISVRFSSTNYEQLSALLIRKKWDDTIILLIRLLVVELSLQNGILRGKNICMWEWK